MKKFQKVYAMIVVFALMMLNLNVKMYFIIIFRPIIFVEKFSTKCAIRFERVVIDYQVFYFLYFVYVNLLKCFHFAMSYIITVRPHFIDRTY